MPHKIERVNQYSDTRFSREVLLEHGAFLIDDKYKCSFKITRENTAIVDIQKKLKILIIIICKRGF